jgi:ABC-2 type transport system permease protein
MTGPSRYFRLFAAFARFSLANEMAFRVNYLIKLLVEILWLGILLIFYLKLFDNTGSIRGWDRDQFLFFVGCYYTLSATIETFFLANCTEFAELVRSGDLDMYLLRPIDEQFLITCRWIDFSTMPNIVLGAAMMIYSLNATSWVFDPLQVVLFVVLFVCGCVLAYSFLLMLSSTAVWLVRNQNLMELWWLFTTLMRYPRDIYRGPWATPFGRLFTYVVPVLLIVSVPAETMVQLKGRLFNWPLIAGTFAATLILGFLSRRFFRRALQSYRSASS